MSKIRVLIYRLDIHNLQAKLVSFPDQEKLLEEVVFSLSVFMNANIKNLQIKHFPCPTYIVIKRLKLYNLQTRKTSENLSSRICLKKPPISTLAKNLRWFELRCIIYRSYVYNLKTRKKLTSIQL